MADPNAGRGSADGTGKTASALRRWREPRTLLVGIVVLAFAFAEGAGIDWISLSLIDGHQLPAVLGLATLVTGALRPLPVQHPREEVE